MQASVLKPSSASYSGVITTADRWSTWSPREGDIIVCTPPKCGTTWTQTMISMLLNGGADLPGNISVISPWIDANFNEASEVARELESQTGRRVIKTHTPADGFPVWEGVTVVAVYRHPLDVFFSLRKHALNMKDNDDHPMCGPVSGALALFLSSDCSLSDFDRDSVATITRHYEETILKNRPSNVQKFHYADMISDPHGTVARLAKISGVGHDEKLISEVTTATSIDVMRSEAHKFAPEGGKGFWNSDAAFFDSGGTAKWHGKLSEEDYALYTARLAELVPDEASRRWLENGSSE